MKVIRIDDFEHHILVERKKMILAIKKAQGIERPRTNHSEAIRAMRDDILKLQGDKKLADELCAILSEFAGERGDNESAADTLRRLIRENEILRSGSQ